MLDLAMWDSTERVQVTSQLRYSFETCGKKCGVLYECQ